MSSFIEVNTIGFGRVLLNTGQINLVYNTGEFTFIEMVNEKELRTTEPYAKLLGRLVDVKK